MAYQCEHCRKKRVKGNNVSHSKRHTRRSFTPNLHFVTMMVDGVVTRMRLCTRCIKTLKKKAKEAAESLKITPKAVAI